MVTQVHHQNNFLFQNLDIRIAIFTMGRPGASKHLPKYDDVRCTRLHLKSIFIDINHGAVRWRNPSWGFDSDVNQCLHYLNVASSRCIICDKLLQRINQTWQFRNFHYSINATTFLPVQLVGNASETSRLHHDSARMLLLTYIYWNLRQFLKRPMIHIDIRSDPIKLEALISTHCCYIANGDNYSLSPQNKRVVCRGNNHSRTTPLWLVSNGKRTVSSINGSNDGLKMPIITLVWTPTTFNIGAIVAGDH